MNRKYFVLFGLHVAGQEDYPTAREALAALCDLRQRGAQGVHVTDENGREVAESSLVALAETEGRA